MTGNNVEIINFFKDIGNYSEYKINVYDNEGKPVNIVFNNHKSEENINRFLKKDEEYWQTGKHKYYKVPNNSNMENLLILESGKDSEISQGHIKLITAGVNRIMSCTRTFFNDRERALKNLIKEELYSNANLDCLCENDNKFRRIIFINSNKQIKHGVYEKLENSFCHNPNNIITSLGKYTVVVFWESEEENSQEIYEIAMNLEKLLEENDMFISWGRAVKASKYIRDSYKDAKSIMDLEKNSNGNRIFDYDTYIIGTYLMELPCSIFEDIIKSILNDEQIEKYKEIQSNKEIRPTVELFFKNNLNVSRTSDDLFVHRNTLNYRLEKITNGLSLNIKEFNEAFKLKFVNIMYDCLQKKRDMMNT